MFSLIITIISIALVAALALATLYYGGSAFNQGSADVRAAEILNEGQQLMAAADLHKAELGVYPDTVLELVSKGYLKSIPTSQSTLGNAYAQAAPAEWQIPQPGVPVFTLEVENSDTCRTVNKKTYGLDGVLPSIRSQYVAQCWGAKNGELITRLQVVYAKGGASLQDAAGSLLAPVVSTLLPPAANLPDWVIPPGVTVGGSTGGGSGNGGGSPALPPITPPEFYCQTDASTVSQGGFVIGSVGGADGFSKFSGGTVTMQGQPLTPLFGPSQEADGRMSFFYFAPGTLTPGQADLVFTATDGTTVSCTLFTAGFDVATPPISDINLPNGVGTSTGGQTVVVTPVGGVFGTTPETKPVVTMGNARIPDHLVTVVSPNELRFTSVGSGALNGADPFNFSVTLSERDGAVMARKDTNYSDLAPNVATFRPGTGYCQYTANGGHSVMRIDVLENDWFYGMFDQGISVEFSNSNGDIIADWGPFYSDGGSVNGYLTRTGFENTAWNMGQATAATITLHQASTAYLDIQFYGTTPSFFSTDATNPMTLSIIDNSGVYRKATMRVYCDYSGGFSDSYGPLGVPVITSTTDATALP